MKRIALELVVALLLATALAMSTGGLRGDAEVAVVREQIAPGTKLVLIGNSMLSEGVDTEALGAALGLTASNVWRGGSSSAWWYVALKNHVLAADPRPSAVAILFRDAFLTQPTFRVGGEFGLGVRALSTADEPVLEKLVWQPALGPVRHELNTHLAVFRERGQVQERFDTGLHRLPAAIVLFKSPNAVLAATRRVFHPTRQLRSEATRAQFRAERIAGLAQFEFSARLEESLLPHMVSEARQAGVQLILVRIRRRGQTAREDSPELRAYIDALGRWADDEGVALLDFSAEERLTIDHFAGGDHLGPEGRELFTRLLAERLRPVLQP